MRHLLRAAAFGLLQVILTVAAHQVSGRPAPAVLAVAMVVVGAGWGIGQVLLLAIPFSRGRGAIRYAEAVVAMGDAMGPAWLAVLVWGVGLAVVGWPLVIDPEFAALATVTSGVLLAVAAGSSLLAGVAVAVMVARAAARLRRPGWVWGGIVVGLLTATSIAFFRWGARLFG